MMRSISAILCAIALTIATHVVPVRAASIWFAVPGGAGAQTGSDWANASDLTAALNVATSGDQIWAAAGTYLPTTDGDRSRSFVLKSGVALYGGFDQTETTFDQRDWAANVTILSGAIGDSDASDNSYHVVTASGITATAILDGFTIRDGNANASGLPESWNGGGIYLDDGVLALQNLIIRENTAFGQGGGLYSRNSGFMLRDSQIISNTARDGGGGISVSGGQSQFTSILIDSNISSLGPGGGMALDDGLPSLIGVIFHANSANNGGGIFSQSDATFVDVIFDQNRAENNGAPSLHRNGGGFYSIGSPSLRAVTFTHNTADLNGGGFYTGGGQPTLLDTHFIGNGASGTWITDGGGGIYIENGTLTVIQSTFTSNTAPNGGGMMIKGASASILDTAFDDNTAGNGGGMHVFAGSSVLIRNTTFTANTATSGGGGMFVYTSAPQLHDTSFIGNHASYGGAMQSIGALYNEPIHDLGPTLTNATISGNSAYYGGGLSTRSCSLTLVNTVLSGNQANFGGAIYNEHAPTGFTSHPRMTNVTISGNGANDAAITNDNTSPTILNSIIWDSRDGSASIANQGSAMPVIGSSIVQGGLPTGALDAGGNRDIDPQFVVPVAPVLPTSLGDLRLMPGSPAINTGDNQYISVGIDRAGNPRIMNVIVDMGAFEFPSFSYHHYLPSGVRP